MSEVKPVAWISQIGETMNNKVYAAWAPIYRGNAERFRPLYDQSALDAAVAAERERCAKLCDHIEASIWRQYKSETTSNQHTAGRSDGAAHSAALIRNA